MPSPTPSPRDPNGFVTNPPNMVVKVSATARDDINGLLGIVMSYNTERERYLVHMTAAQSTMAFKKENLVQAHTLDSYKAQWQQLKNDPRVKEKMLYYLQVCRNWVSPWKLQYILAGFLLSLVVLMYFFGFTKTVMVLSYAILLLVISGPDILSKKSPRLIAEGFPNRARETLEQHVPIVKGKISNRVAMGVLLFMGGLVLQSLFFVKTNNKTMPSMPLDPNGSGGITTATMSTTTTATAAAQKELLETYYQLGFQDATDENAHGTSLLPALEELEASRVLLHEQQQQQQSQQQTSDYLDDSDLPLSSSSSSSSSWLTSPSSEQKSQFGSITNAMSMFYLYRAVMELGNEQMTGLFSMAQLFANLQGTTIPIWRKGLLALSVYKVLRIFV